MKISRETVLSITCIVLALALLLFVVYGSRCTTETFEGFANVEDKDAREADDDDDDSEDEDIKPKDAKKAKAKVASLASKDGAKFTTQERELFDALMSNSIPDSQIQELINSGIITDTLVGKFLQTMDLSKTTKAADVTRERFNTKKAEITAKAMASDSALSAKIEGFQANQHAAF